MSEPAPPPGRPSEESELRSLRAVIEASGVFIGIYTLDGRATYINPAGRRLIGVDAGRELDAADIYTPDTAAHAKEAMFSVAKRGGHYRGEALFRSFATGEAIPVLQDTFAVRGPEGDIVRVATITRDLRERRAIEADRQTFLVQAQAAQADAESERRRLYDLFMQAPVAIAILEGPTHVYTFANPSYRALVNGRDVLGKPLHDALPDVRELGFDALMDRVMQSGEPFVADEMPIKLEHHTGDDALILNFVYSPKRNAAGEVDGVVMSGLDVTELVRARQRAETLAHELRQSEERLRHVVEASGAGTWEVDLASRTMKVDARFRHFYGLPPDRPITLAMAIQATPEGDRDRVSAIVERALAGADGGRYTLEHRTDAREGEASRWVEVRGQTVFDEQGHAGGLVGTVVDITARKAAEHELRAKSERLDLLMSNTQDYAVILTDTTGVVTEWQGGAETITGYAAREAIGQRGDILFTPEDRAESRPEIEMTMAALLGRAEDKRWHRRKDGGRFYADGVMTALYNERGELHGFGKVFRDATAQKQAEEALRLSEERLHFALRAGRMGTWDLVTATGELSTSDTCKANYGRGPDDPFTYADLAASVVAADREEWQREMARAVARCTDLDVEYRVHWPDGSVHWLNVRASCAADAHGHATGMSGVSIDIDERKRIEEELRAADRRKDEFLTTASHELRTPLNAILGWAHMLRAGRLDANENRRAAETIERNARAQVQIIEDILDGARMISGKLRLEVRPLDLTALVRAAVEAIQPAADAKQITLSVGLDPAAARITGDPDRLQQVVWNLGSNAIKFTPKGGEVQIRLARVGASVELRVSDTGQGIAAEFLPHVFERFRQADGSTTRRHGGLGLGLALVRHLVDAHGGEVRAESPGEGRGSTFVVTLPAQATFVERRAVNQPEGRLGPGARAESDLHGVTALVVDDEADARDLVATVLRLHGADVVTAGSAAEALALLVELRPTVILSDIGMPGTDGYELMRRVRAATGADRAHTPAVALTAYAREEDKRLALAAGFRAHVAKPIEPSQLVQIVASVAKPRG